MGRRKSQPKDSGVFHFTSTRAFYDKAVREKDRYAVADDIDDKIDHFLNFALAATAAVEQCERDLRQWERANHRKAENLRKPFSQSAIVNMRALANRYKHGASDADGLELATCQIHSSSLVAKDGKIDVSSPELSKFWQTDVMHIHVGGSPAVIAFELVLKFKDGTEVQAWNEMETAIHWLSWTFSQFYAPATEASSTEA